MDKFLIVGLGNPGTRYAKTRHNAGTDLINKLAENYSLNLKENKSLKGKNITKTIYDKADVENSQAVKKKVTIEHEIDKIDDKTYHVIDYKTSKNEKHFFEILTFQNTFFIFRYYR